MPEQSFTIKYATQADFGYQYSAGADDTAWPRQYRSFTSHAVFNAELLRVAGANELRSPNMGLTAYTAAFQPIVAYKPGATSSEDRHVLRIWDLPSGKWIMAAVFDGSSCPILSYACASDLISDRSCRGGNSRIR